MNWTVPIYLIESTQQCWKCASEQPVIALGSPVAFDEEGNILGPGDEFVLLSEIQTMPATLLTQITAVSHRYRKKFSRTAGIAYYANHCECGANFGDHFLYSTPGGAFFPETEEVASQIRMRLLTISSPFDIECSTHVGTIGEMIWIYAERLR